MSARREKRLRKLERRIEALEKLAASPVMTIDTRERPTKAPSILERLRKRVELWKFCRKYLQPGVSLQDAEEAFKSWKVQQFTEYLKKHPPKAIS